MSADDRYVAERGLMRGYSTLALGNCGNVIKKIPFFDVVIFCALAILFYTVYPLVNY